MQQIRFAMILVAAGSVFGSAFLFIKVLIDEVDPMTLVALRLFLGAAAVLGVIALRRQRLGWTPVLAAKVGVLAVLGLVIPYGLISWAESHIDSGIAAALISTMPLFTAVYATFLFTDERITLGRVAGLLAGFAGVVALSGADFDVTDSSVLGQLAVVGAAASYGAGAALSRKLLKTEEPLSLAGLELVLAALIATPLALAIDGSPDLAISAKAWGSLLALGVGATGLAFIAYLWLVDNAGSVRASLVTYVVPVVGLFLGRAVLGEQVGLNAIAGTALIVLGVAGAMFASGPGSQRRPEAAAAPEATSVSAS